MGIQQDILALPCIRHYSGFITVTQPVHLFSTGKEKSKRTLDVYASITWNFKEHEKYRVVGCMMANE